MEVAYPKDGLTDREVLQILGFSDMNAVRPRITELVDLGELEEVGNTLCTVTGHEVRLVRPTTASSRIVAPKADTASIDKLCLTLAFATLSQTQATTELRKTAASVVAALLPKVCGISKARGRTLGSIFRAIVLHRRPGTHGAWAYLPGEAGHPLDLPSWLHRLETTPSSAPEASLQAAVSKRLRNLGLSTQQCQKTSSI